MTYVAPVIGSAVSANKNHLGLFNAATGGHIIDIVRVDANSHLTAANTGTATHFYLKRTTAGGTGTAVTIRKHDTRCQAAPASVAAQHTFTVQPTEDTAPELSGVSMYTEETTSQTPKMPVFQADPQRGIMPISLRPGQGIVFQQGPLASAGAISVFIYFKLRKR